MPKMTPEQEALTSYVQCSCGCGCEADGDWHYTEPIGCRCQSQGCPCVIDRPGAGVLEKDRP